MHQTVCLHKSQQLNAHCFSIIQSMHHHHHHHESPSFPLHFLMNFGPKILLLFQFLFLFVSAGAEATGPPADGGQVLSGEKR